MHNKSVLEKPIGGSAADIADAIAKKHTQGTDTTLGAMAADINMNTHQVTALSVPDAAGEAIRQTAKITEVSLESAADLKHTQGADTTLGTQAEALDMGGYQINNLADPSSMHDAVSLEYLQNKVGVGLNYWLEASNVMQSLYVGTPAFVTNVSSAQGTEVELTSIYWASSLAQTPAPFVIKNGAEFLVHTGAKVSTGHYAANYKTVKIRAKLYHTNSAGADLVQIGATTSDSAILTETNVLQELSGIVATEVSVPASRRLLVKMFCYVTTGAQPNYPTIAVEYGDVHDHCTLPVTGAIFGNFLPLAGGTMTGTIVYSAAQQAIIQAQSMARSLMR